LLVRYPEVVQELRQLYAEKQHAQMVLDVLKRTIYTITRARENLANRYLSKVENLFNSYLQIWLKNEAIRGTLDVEFKVTVEEGSKVHVTESYSAGYYDLIDLCMRLALVDTLFEKEQPFLILDDPFVNLDDERIKGGLQLLRSASRDYQILYLTCHESRCP
jgi:DNA repair exonuclease SbcCD ATPase subunit